AGKHELLPQPFGVLAGEFARQRIDRSHSPDGHEERLVAREPLLAERRDLLAEVILELRRVRTADRPAPAQMRPPRVDLSFEGIHRRIGHALLHRLNPRPEWERRFRRSRIPIWWRRFSAACRPRCATGGARPRAAACPRRSRGSTYAAGQIPRVPTSFRRSPTARVDGGPD